VLQKSLLSLVDCTKSLLGGPQVRFHSIFMEPKQNGRSFSSSIITNPSKDGTKQNCLCVYIVKVLWSHLVYFQTSKMLRNFCVYALALMATK